MISELLFYNPEIKVNDHAVDALRYAVSDRPPLGSMQISFAKRPW